MPYVLTNSALTLLEQQPREEQRASASQAALTRRTGQPGALDARTAGHWAGPTATLYTDLNCSTAPPSRLKLSELPFLNRYHAFVPATQLDALDRPAQTEAFGRPTCAVPVRR